MPDYVCRKCKRPFDRNDLSFFELSVIGTCPVCEIGTSFPKKTEEEIEPPCLHGDVYSYEEGKEVKL